MDILLNILQQFGFPVALAAALVYWWRKDYASLVKRVREIEDARAMELKAYANSYKILAEQVTEALEQNNRVTRQLLHKLGEHTFEKPTEHHHKSYDPRAHRTPLPFKEEQS